MFISKLLMASAMLLAFTLNGYGVEHVDCPTVDEKNNIFDASVLIKHSIISIENGTVEYPLVLDLYRPTKDGCERAEIARYPVEGGAPTVESLFFMPLHGRINVFSIIAWDINNRGDGTYGRLYQVYAYGFDENEVLVENKRVSGDDSMTGVEGYVQGKKSEFPYKTASKVKKYWCSNMR